MPFTTRVTLGQNRRSPVKASRHLSVSLLAYLKPLNFLGLFILFFLGMLLPSKTMATPMTSNEAVTTVSLAAEDSWPPFADQFGKGISHQLIQSAYQQVGIKLDSIVVPYPRGLRMTEKGSVDGVFNVTKEASTQDRFIFGKQSLFSTSASFYQNNQKPINVKSKSAIPPHTIVGIIEGYEYGDELPKLIESRQLTIVTVTSQKQLINLLLVNRIDVAIMFDLVAKIYVEKMGVEQDISPVFNNHCSEIFVAFSKKSPNGHYLAQKLDEGLLKLKSQGQYAKLLHLSNK